MQNTILRYKGLEILCKPNTIAKYRDKKLGRDKVLVSDEIFKSVQKANRAKVNDLQKTFGTSDLSKCIDIMLENGEYQISAEERKEKAERKRREIIEYIHSHYIDGKAKTLIPVTRIENALKEMKVRVDADLSIEKLLQPVIKQLPQYILGLKKVDDLEIELIISHKYHDKLFNVIKKHGSLVSKDANNYGYIYRIRITSNDMESLLNNLNKVTSDYQLKICD